MRNVMPFQYVRLMSHAVGREAIRNVWIALDVESR